MERDIPMDLSVNSKPLEIDIRKILEQLGIQKEKWPEEYKNPVEQS
jgi:signal recognition particle subunit SEC65